MFNMDLVHADYYISLFATCALMELLFFLFPDRGGACLPLYFERAEAIAGSRLHKTASDNLMSTCHSILNVVFLLTIVDGHKHLVDAPPKLCLKPLPLKRLAPSIYTAILKCEYGYLLKLCVVWCFWETD